jgi:bisphosphoglycerate-independent phosphoglycerate mutase (AlkP superfamily)
VLADDGAKPNRKNMSLIDFAPTMLAYLGAEIPSYMTGRSVV